MRFTTRQKKLLMFIYDHMTAYGFSPTIREIAKAIGTNSTSVANYNVNNLVRKGYLAKAAEKSRTITLTDNGLALIKRVKSMDDSSALMIDDELERLRTENQQLKLENERLRERIKAKLIELQRELLMSANKVR